MLILKNREKRIFFSAVGQLKTDCHNQGPVTAYLFDYTLKKELLKFINRI